jgi:hypothetical protein
MLLAPILFQRYTKWYYDIVSLLPNNTQSSTSTVLEQHTNKRCLPEERSMPTMSSVPTQKKRRKGIINRHGATGHFLTTDDPERAMKQARSARQETPTLEERNKSTSSEPPPIISCSDSSNAFSLFGEQVHKNDEDANSDADAWDVKAMVRKRIGRLRSGHITVGGWKLTV